jgi:hypothetical protein
MRKILLLFFLYTILGLINSQSSNIVGNSTKLLIRRKKNLMKSLDKMIIKRNLDEEDTISEDIGFESSSEDSDLEESSSEDSDLEESSSEDSDLEESSFESSPNQTQSNITVEDQYANIYLIDIINYNLKSENHIATFNIIFYFVRSRVMKYVFFTLRIVYYILRNLDEIERLAICKLEDDSYAGEQANKIVKYICETNDTIDLDNNLIIKAEKDFKSGDSEDVNKASSIEGLSFSRKIENDLQNIQNKTQTIKNYYILTDGIYDDLNNNRFTIKGKMDNRDINDKEVNITLYHNENEERNVVCNVIKNQTNDYQMRCNAQNRTLASLVSAYGITDQNNVITIYMKERYDKINTASEIKNRIYSKKSGSGLSGGGIAGIVIASVATLVIASIVAIMLRKPKPRIQNTSSIIQANSVDNLNG